MSEKTRQMRMLGWVPDTHDQDFSSVHFNGVKIDVPEIIHISGMNGNFIFKLDKFENRVAHYIKIGEVHSLSYSAKK